jgi:NADH-quinone oxidoreductase subunit K
VISLNSYLLIGAFLFATGLACILMRRNMIQILMGVELVLNAAALNFVAFAHFLGKIEGQVVAVFVIVLAAAEAAVALALVLAVYRLFKTVDITEVKDLKG